jgi:hypothetical protein
MPLCVGRLAEVLANIHMRDAQYNKLVFDWSQHQLVLSDRAVVQFTKVIIIGLNT